VICTTIAGVNAAFFAEYKFPNSDEPHIFTPLHQWAQTQKKRWLVENKQQAIESDTNAVSTTDDAAASTLSSPMSNTNHNDNVSELRRIAKGHR
jgi:hypothetical protein